MQPKTINPDTATIEELKVFVYDLNLEKNFYQEQINDLNKNINVLNSMINEKVKEQKKAEEEPVAEVEAEGEPVVEAEVENKK